MTHTHSRRALLRGAGALLAGSALAACTVTTNGGTTSIVLDVAKIAAYGQAGLNAAATVTGLLAAIPAAAAYVPLITAAETALSGALNAFTAAAGSTLTINYNDTNWKTRVDSVLNAVVAVGTALGSALKGAGSAIPSSVSTAISTAVSALKTVISLFEGLVGISPQATLGRRAVAAPEMSEAQALRILGVTR